MRSEGKRCIRGAKCKWTIILNTFRIFVLLVRTSESPHSVNHVNCEAEKWWKGNEGCLPMCKMTDRQRDSPMAVKVTIFAPITGIGVIWGHDFLNIVNVDGVFLKDASQLDDEVIKSNYFRVTIVWDDLRDGWNGGHLITLLVICVDINNRVGWRFTGRIHCSAEWVKGDSCHLFRAI